MPDPEPAPPVFYDAGSRRWFWIVRLSAALGLVATFGLTCLVISILALPLLPFKPLPRSKDVGAGINANPGMTARQRLKRQFLQRRDKKLLAADMQAELKREQQRADRVNSLLLRRAQTAIAAGTPPPIVAGFYVNWEETSRASLRRNILDITMLFPEWLHLNHAGTGFLDGRIAEDRVDVEPFVRLHKVPIIPVLNNYVGETDVGSGDWDPQALHSLVSSPAARTSLIKSLKTAILANHWQGINIDFELVDTPDRANLVAFMRQLYAVFHRANLLVTQDIEMDSDALDLQKLALWNDYVIPMLYDQHSPGDPQGAGSLAAIDWTRAELQSFFAQVPAGKALVGLGGYAYDWKKGEWQEANTLSYQDAVIQAKESQDPDDPTVASIHIDPQTLNPYYSYYDDSGAVRIVWMLDATTTYNQWQVARQWAPRGAAFWMLGSEDPGVWSIIGARSIAKQVGPAIDSGILNQITYGRQSEVDFEGEGELLDVVAQPSDGKRIVRRDPKTGLIVAEDYQAYPSAYVVRRYGTQPHKIALTFDDGPDPTYTPQVLDTLEREGVHATFFVIGKNAESYPGLVAREWDDGDDIGNHTFTHPNLALEGPERTLLEISTTQRIIEAITGRATTLFRPPYAIDVEPRTGGELRPIILASKANFVSVGETNDPQDWNVIRTGPHGLHTLLTPTMLVDSVWSNRDAGTVVLFHDGGGDRSATVAALPRIIDRLKAAGYGFITISQLRGLPRDVMFPRVTGREEALAGVDRWVFETSYLMQRTLTFLFMLSVTLGVTRQFWMMALALIQRRRELRREARLAAAPPVTELVSVIIAAYNEAKVICRTVGALLNSDYKQIEVIVVDDGSADATADRVVEEFGADPRVQVMRKPNGGKASALTAGLTLARGGIVVALDADTLFAPTAIGLLVRHFADPRVGAVSGNVHVGNVRNILTKWQALEYVTSQNFDRRAYDLLNCITVVPGAIGAWRRTAIDHAGGYASDTLAEDTDLTWRIRMAGWRVQNDSTAQAYTEAPETLRNLARQRYRWAFGTLQNLFKHRDATLRYGTFGWVAIPSLWIYQVVFPAISPIMDITVVWALATGNVPHVLAYYALMVGAELVGAAVAVSMDRGQWGLLPWLLLQRLVYRQLMYYVLLKSLVSAARGGAVGWNKFERRGTVSLEGKHQ